MTPPLRYLWRMIGFLVAVGAVAGMLSGALIDAFASNPVLNSVISCVLLVGIAWTVRQVLMLRLEVEWLERFRSPRPDAPAQPAPRLLGPMASMFAARRADRLSLSGPAMRSVLDGIASRLDEQREVSRYMIGLLIFLGLLGTFWGLLLTIASISDVIGNMSVGSGDVNQLFNQLKAGLAQPLRGMGTAFSASMLGLAGALVLGFLDLSAGQAQTRFFNELEEWLAGITRLSSGVLGSEGEGGGGVPAYVQALLEQTAENLEALQRTLERGEEGRVAGAHALNTLTERLAVLADQMRAGQSLMLRVAEQQSALAPALQRLADARASGALDEQSRSHLRNMEIYMARLLEEVAQGRAQSTAEIRNEIKVLARTIAAIAEEAPR